MQSNKKFTTVVNEINWDEVLDSCRQLVPSLHCQGGKTNRSVFSNMQKKLAVETGNEAPLNPTT